MKFCFFIFFLVECLCFPSVPNHWFESQFPSLHCWLPVYFVPSIYALIPCTFSPILPFLPSTGNPSCDLHFCDSLPSCLLRFYFILFIYFFYVQLLIVVSLLSFHCSYFWSSSFSYISPLNISYNKGLVMMNFFNLSLSEKHFIFPSILNDSFAG